MHQPAVATTYGYRHLTLNSLKLNKTSNSVLTTSATLPLLRSHVWLSHCTGQFRVGGRCLSTLDLRPHGLPMLCTFSGPCFASSSFTGGLAGERCHSLRRLTHKSLNLVHHFLPSSHLECRGDGWNLQDKLEEGSQGQG